MRLWYGQFAYQDQDCSALTRGKTLLAGGRGPVKGDRTYGFMIIVLIMSKTRIAPLTNEISLIHRFFPQTSLGDPRSLASEDLGGARSRNLSMRAGRTIIDVGNNNPQHVASPLGCLFQCWNKHAQCNMLQALNVAMKQSGARARWTAAAATGTPRAGNRDVLALRYRYTYCCVQLLCWCVSYQL